MTTTPKSSETSFLEKPLFKTVTLNWEVTLYIIILVLALFSRFYMLGDRVMSHDESLHALFSYKLYDGEGYKHDPLMHGPLQFHLVALSYVLFGDNDFAARVPAALFGVALVMMPILFRRWLGKWGALITSFGLLISPMLLYYERYIRNESYSAFFTAAMALALFQFMRTRKQVWLYVGAISVSLFISSKEIAYIHGFIGAVFIAAAWMWETLSEKRLRQVVGGLVAVTVAVFALAMLLPVFNPPPDGALPEGGGLPGILLMLSGLLVAVLTIVPNTDRRDKPVSTTVRQFFNWEQAVNLLAGPVVAAAIVFFLLHTTFFTNPAGFISGTWGAVSYWLKQQDVARGGQPGYYYVMLMPMYEFLPLFLGGIGGIVYLFKKAPAFYRPEPAPAIDAAPDGGKHRAHKTASPAPAGDFPADGGTFAAYLIFWTIASFVMYSWAGEKMPWLTVHITLPFIFLMGHVSQSVLDGFDWTTLRQKSGLIVTLLLPVLGAAVIAALTADAFQGQSLPDLQATARFFVALLAALGAGYGLWLWGRKLNRADAKRIVYVVLFTVLSVLTVRFAWLSSFVNYDYVNEFLVYAHAAPDVKWMLDEIDDISRRTVGDRQIKVAYGGVIWPLEWYMRNYPNRAFFGANPSREALADAPVVIISPDENVKLEDVEPYLGDNYQRFDYRQVWWPIENYKNQSLKKLWNTFFVPAPTEPIEGQNPAQARAAAWETVHANRKWLWDVLFYRKINDQSFDEWPYRTQMYFFVRKDIAAQLWDYSTGGVAVQAAAPDPYADIRQDVAATLVWGSEGSGDAQFIGPRAVAVSPQGQLYVSDSANHRIQVFDQNGNFLKQWGGQTGPEPGQFGDEIWGIAVSADGKVYVADTWNHRVQVFDEDGNFLSQFGAFADAQSDATAFPGSFWGPRDLALDAEGNLYVADTGNKRIQKFSSAGEFLQMWGGGGITPGRFEEPTGLAIDAEGNIYVADTWNQRVQKFDADFNPVLDWPVDGWDTQNVLNKPYIAVDSRNRVFVTDPENYRVIGYDGQTGAPLTVFGQYGRDVQSFRLPLGLVVGPDDALFVVDADNNRVMKFEQP